MFIFSALRSGPNYKDFVVIIVVLVEHSLTKEQCPEYRGHGGQKDMVTLQSSKLVSQGMCKLPSLTH